MLTAKLTIAQRVYLDFARAAAALAVLTGHAANIFLQGSRVANSNIEIVGVLVFFLLSGFLISFSVFQKHKEPEYGFTEYFIDRFCRIYCAFLPALALVAVLDSWSIRAASYVWQERLNIQTAVGNVLMLQEFPLFQFARRAGVPDTTWFIRTFGSAGPFWTISIEWWIYMVFGAIVLVRLRTHKPFKPWQWLLLGFAAIEPAYNLVAGPDRCLTMLWMVGMSVSFAFVAKPQWFTAEWWSISEQRWRRACYIGGISCIIALVVHKYAQLVHQGSASIAEFQSGVLLGGALFALLFAFSGVRHVPHAIERTVGFIANYSYSLYLTHFSILILVKTLFPRDYDPLAFIVAIALSNVVAVMFWYLFERHYRNVATLLKTMIGQRRHASSAMVRKPL